MDDTYNYILNIAKVGMTERELKALLESKMLELGADGHHLIQSLLLVIEGLCLMELLVIK